MYTISSLNYSPEAGKPQSPLKPVGKAAAISLAIEILAGAAILSAGLYILLHHGIDISHIGTLGNKVGYLCLIAPGAVVLDFLIGSVIKGVKNFNSLKQKQLKPEIAEKKPRIQQLREEYNVLKTTRLSELTESTPVVPERRVCGFGGIESEKTIRNTKSAVFVTEEDIKKKHPMKFLPNSPFITEDTSRVKKILESIKDESTWASLLGATKKKAQAIAITEEGKHIILQQTAKSCVPTCMAMLILDRRKQPNYEAIRETYLATTEQAIGWAKEAQLECRVTKIPRENPIEILSKCLVENGPGMLSVDHPTIGGHVVILDEISVEKNEAVIRDSFHGWMITINLNALKEWLDGDFVQIV